MQTNVLISKLNVIFDEQERAGMGKHVSLSFLIFA